MKFQKGAFFIVIAAISWGAFPLFTRIAYSDGANALMTASMRALFAAVMYAVYGLMISVYKQVKLKDMGFFALYGLVSLSGTFVFYALAIERLSLAMAVILLYTAPAFVTIFNRIIFKEPISKRKLIALMLTTMGCALVVRLYAPEAFAADALGIFFGILSGLCYSMFSIFGRYGLTKYSPEANAIFPNIFAALALQIICPIWTVKFSMSLTGAYFLIGLLGSFLPYLIYLKGLSKGIESTNASIIASVEPLFATLFAFIFLKESIEAFQMVGIALVLIGASLPALSSRVKKAPDDDANINAVHENNIKTKEVK